MRWWSFVRLKVDGTVIRTLIELYSYHHWMFLQFRVLLNIWIGSKGNKKVHATIYLMERWTWQRPSDFAMLDVVQEEAAPVTLNMSNKKKELLSTAMKRTSEWFASYLWCYRTWANLSYTIKLNSSFYILKCLF